MDKVERRLLVAIMGFIALGAVLLAAMFVSVLIVGFGSAVSFGIGCAAMAAAGLSFIPMFWLLWRERKHYDGSTRSLSP